MEWLFVSLASVIYVIGCWLTYSEKAQKEWWYMPLGVFLGMMLNIIWFYAARWFGDKDKMYAFSLLWDVILMLVYYSLPLLFFGTKLDKYGWIALILIVSGTVLLKVKS